MLRISYLSGNQTHIFTFLLSNSRGMPNEHKMNLFIEEININTVLQVSYKRTTFYPRSNLN